jgi:hypothetical protein
MTTPSERTADTTSTTGAEAARADGHRDTVERPPTYGAHERHVHDHHDRDDRDFVASRDLVRWGPLWAGVVVAVASYLVMQLAIFALDLFSEGGNSGTWLSAIAALVAFFLGGLVVGATALWHSTGHGAINGAIMWAFATVGLVLLAVLGGGSLAGPVSTVAADLGAIQDLNLQNPPTDQINQALQGAREAAGWALLGLGLSLVASVVGGVAGAKIWPSRDTAGTTGRDAELV